MSRKTISINETTYNDLLKIKLDLSTKREKQLSFEETIRELINIARDKP